MQKAAWYIVLTLVVLFMSAAVIIYVAPHLGWHVNAVLSGSMEPKIKVGALVVTRPIEPEEVVVGDIITFLPVSVGENMITHRVIGIGYSSSLFFETKGDANNKPDPFSVPAQNLIGKICFIAPYWGFFTEFLKTPIGFLFSVVIPGVVIFTAYVLAILRAISERKENQLEKQRVDEY
ncbi:signal peptidase I [Chloroflexota bacterium]